MTSYATVAELRAYLPQVADLGQQLITISGSPAGGTFTLSYEGTASAAIAYNATATAVQTALRGITAIGSSGVNVRGRPGGPWIAAFQGTLATDAGPLSLGTNSLTGGTSPTVTMASAADDTLQDCLDRATDIVRSAMRSLLADPTFDYTAFAAASTKIVRGYDTHYLHLPAYDLMSVTLVEYQSGSNPSVYTTLESTLYEAQSDGRLYRPSGWGGGYSGDDPRYRITAIWGYGPTPPTAIVETTLEVAVNIYRSRDKGGWTDTIGADGAGATTQVSGLTSLQKQTLCSLRDELQVMSV